jgi:adenylate cyclase
VWADRYDRQIRDIFAVQDEVVRAIVAMVSDRVDDASMQSARRKRPGNLLAYDYFLRGAAYHLSFDRTDNQMARAMFEKAITLEPGLAAAYAWLATQHMRDWFSHQSTEASDRAFALAQKGVTLDPGDSVCEMMLGFVCLYRKQLDDAVLHLTRAIALNPNDPNNAVTMALLQTYFGNSDEAIEWMNKAFELNPYPPPWYFSLYGTVLYAARRYADAIAAFKRVDTSLDPNELIYLVASMGQLDRIEEAQRHAAQFRALYPETAIRQIVALEPFRDAGDREHLLDGLRKVGAIE